MFDWILARLAEAGLVKGKTLGVDATTRSIVRRDTGDGHQKFLEGLAKASGVETPTRENLSRLDRKRKNKGSNAEWVRVPLTAHAGAGAPSPHASACGNCSVTET